MDPDLNYLWWSPTEIFGTGPSSIASNFARNTDPQIETLLQQGRTSTDPATRAAAYQGVAKRLNVDLPYIWQDRATWAVVANSERAELEQPDDARRRQGVRHDRGNDLDPPDLEIDLIIIRQVHRAPGPGRSTCCDQSPMNRRP